MRKLIALFAVTVVAASALAQGQVDFQNRLFNTAGDRLVYNTLSSGGAALVGTSFVAQLYFGTQGATSLAPADLAPIRFRAATTTYPGTWGAAPGYATLAGIAIGQTATLQVRVWDSVAYPAGYDAAVAGGGVRGASALFDYTVPAAGSPPASYYMENFTRFNLVPEPSTIALGVLGLAGLLFIRRRK
jgi:hypothetical protein